MACCHKNNVVHRDLKPENIIVHKNGKDINVKLIGFGTSCKFDPNLKMITAQGTPYYLAPEVINGSYGKECDLWSCGIILHVMLLGTPPFEGETLDDILLKIKECKLSLRGELYDNSSEMAIDLMKKLIEPTVSRRITAAQAAGHKWLS